MKRLFCLISLVLFFAQAAFAQQTSLADFNSSVTPSMQAIAIGKGSVTKKEYDQFWSDFGVSDGADKSQLVAIMRKNFLVVQDYQQELWKCVKQAWVSQAVPICAKADAKYSMIRKNMEKMNQEAMLQSMQTTANNLLSSAARRDKTTTVSGQKVQLSAKLIDDTNRALAETFSRFDQVLQENYRPKR